MSTAYSISHSALYGAAAPAAPVPRKQWYRTWSDEHQRFFYWDSETNVSTWDEPSVSEKIIDYATNKEVERQTASTSAPVIHSSSLHSVLGLSTSGSSQASSLLQSSPKLTSKKPEASRQVSNLSSPGLHPSATAALKAVLHMDSSSSSSRPVVATHTSAVQSVKPVLSAEKMREIEEADRKIAERLQAEMDKEFEETKATMPSPAEALLLMKQQQSKKKGKAVKNEEDGSEDGLKDSLAEQGFVVKVTKKKKH